MNEQRLRKYFHFTESDLEANRRGEFSDAQKKRLAEKAKAEQKSARGSAAILFVIAFLGMTIGLTLGLIAPSLIGRIFMISLMGILWPLVWAGRGVKIIRDALAGREPILRSVSGRAYLIHAADGDIILQLNGLEFDLEENVSGAIIEGYEYTLYYLDINEEILSAE